MSSLLEAGMNAHAAGRLGEAEAAYGQILEADAGHADATHLLGVIAFQRGALDDALALIRRAIAVNEVVPLYHSNLGRVAKAAERLDEAVQAYRRALSLAPRSADIHSDLAAALLAKGDISESIQSSRAALALDPRSVNAHYNLGLALRELGWKAEAEVSFRKALGTEAGRPDILFHLALTLQEKGELDGAADCYRRSLAIAPGLTDSLCNLGNVLRAQGHWDEAIDCYRQALVQTPGQAEIHANLGVALQETGNLTEALSVYEKALALAPEHAELRRNRALALLQSGRLAEGWVENEWRWRTRAFRRVKSASAAPPWDGQPLDGKTILISAEQGLGDTLHFIRYAPLVAARGASVILECQGPLISLLGRMPGIRTAVATGGQPPHHDMQMPLLSLPRIFGTTLENIPQDVSYIAPLPDEAEAWAAKFASCSGMKVGLVWAGDPKHANDRNRSMPARALLPLLDIPGLRFFSLQLGARREDSTSFPPGLVTDLSQDIASFEDTAAILANLDLLLTVDTAVCHLAGAMARPTWVMLSVAHDWRWFDGRDESPWYPSLRLFRQVRPGDWSELVERVAKALADRIGEATSR